MLSYKKILLYDRYNNTRYDSASTAAAARAAAIDRYKLKVVGASWYESLAPVVSFLKYVQQ